MPYHIPADVPRERRPTEELLAVVALLADVRDRLVPLSGLASQWNDTANVNAAYGHVQAARDGLLTVLANAEAWRRSLPPRPAKPAAAPHLTGRDPADEL